MSLPVQLIVDLYAQLLKPIPQLAALGLPVGTLDVLGMLRLTLVVKQIKHSLKMKALKNASKEEKERTLKSLENDESLLGSVWPILVIVYGGEFVVSPFVSRTPSFFTSPVGPILITLCHFVVSLSYKYGKNVLPLEPSLKTELPLSVVDALTRAMLLCSIGPPAILGHKSASVNDSATALLLTSAMLTNGGFFIVNWFNMLSPYGWQVATPPELKPWGWFSMDIMSAPSITALFAILTGSQSFWSTVNSVAFNYAAGNGGLAGNVTGPAPSDGNRAIPNTTPEKGPTPGPFDAETARAICAMVLLGLFSARTVRNYGPPSLPGFGPRAPKAKTQ